MRHVSSSPTSMYCVFMSLHDLADHKISHCFLALYVHAVCVCLRLIRGFVEGAFVL